MHPIKNKTNTKNKGRIQKSVKIFFAIAFLFILVTPTNITLAETRTPTIGEMTAAQEKGFAQKAETSFDVLASAQSLFNFTKTKTLILIADIKDGATNVFGAFRSMGKKVQSTGSRIVFYAGKADNEVSDSAKSAGPQIGNKLEKVWKASKSMGQTFSDLSKSAMVKTGDFTADFAYSVKSAGKGVGFLASGAKNGLSFVVGGAKNGFARFGESFGQAPQALVKGVAHVAVGIVNGSDAALAKMSQGLPVIAQGTGRLVYELGDTVSRLGNGVYGSAEGTVKGTVALTSGVSNASIAIYNNAQNAEMALENLRGLVKMPTNILPRLATAAKNVNDSLDSAKNAVPSIAGKVATAISSTPSTIGSAAKKIMASASTVPGAVAEQSERLAIFAYNTMDNSVESAGQFFVGLKTKASVTTNDIFDKRNRVQSDKHGDDGAVSSVKKPSRMLALVDTAKEATQEVPQNLGEGVGAITTGITGVIDGVSGGMVALGDSLSNIPTDLGSQAANLGILFAELFKTIPEKTEVFSKDSMESLNQIFVQSPQVVGRATWQGLLSFGRGIQNLAGDIWLAFQGRKIQTGTTIVVTGKPTEPVPATPQPTVTTPPQVIVREVPAKLPSIFGSTTIDGSLVVNGNALFKGSEVKIATPLFLENNFNINSVFSIDALTGKLVSAGDIVSLGKLSGKDLTVTGTVDFTGAKIIGLAISGGTIVNNYNNNYYSTSGGGGSTIGGQFDSLNIHGTADIGSSLLVGGDLTVNGNTTLGNASSDVLTINASTVSIPNGITFSNGTVSFGSGAGSTSTFGGNIAVDGTGTSTFAYGVLMATLGGNVGIGTSSPAHALDVDGTIQAADLITKGPTADVRAFGAKGDGVTDDTIAINAAFASVPSTGGTVLFPKGNYKVTARLTPKSNTLIKGNFATITQATATTITLYINDLSNVIIEGLQIVGVGTDYNASATTEATLIYVYYSDNIIIRNNKLTNFGYSGVVFDHSDSIWIEDNVITGPGSSTIAAGGNYNFGVVGYDTGVGHSGIYIKGNDISQAAGGISTSPNWSGIQIVNNNIHDIVGQHGMYVSIYNSIIANNTIATTHDDCILLSMATGDTVNHNNTTISNNNLYDCGNVAINVRALSTATYSLNNIHITGNTVASSSYGVYLSNAATAGANTDNVVSNNTFRDIANYGVITDGVTGSIVNNYFSDIALSGIYASSTPSDTMVISGNTLINAANNGTPGASSNNGIAVNRMTAIIRNNNMPSIGSTADYTIYSSSDSTVTLDNNYLTTSKGTNLTGSIVYAGGLFSSGSYGMGTTAPTSTLTLGGITAATPWLTIGNGAASTTFGGYSMTATSTHPYGINFATSGGNVGIGTTSPGYLLDVNGTFRATGLFIPSGGISTSTLDNIIIGGSTPSTAYFTRTSSTLSSVYQGLFVGTTATSSIYGHTTSTFPYGVTFATTGGNVGIGTTAPKTKLDVQGTVSSTNFYANAGSVAIPSYSFAGDPDTGFYNNVANTMGLALGGTQYYSFASDYLYNTGNITPFSAGVTQSVTGRATDAATAVATIVNNLVSLTGGKLLSIRNNSVEKAYFDYSGALNWGNGSVTSSLAVGNRGSATSTFYSDLSIINRDLLVGGAPNSGWGYFGDGTATTSIRGGTAGSATTTFAGDVVIPNMYLGSIEFATDNGLTDFVNAPVSASATTGTLQGGALLGDGIPSAIWGCIADAGGSCYNWGLGVNTSTLYYGQALNVHGNAFVDNTLTARTAGLFGAATGATSTLTVAGTAPWLTVGNGTASTTITGHNTSTFPYGITFATTGGNVGIGTASPGYKLQINDELMGSNPTAGVVNINANDTGYDTLIISNAGTDPGVTPRPAGIHFKSSTYGLTTGYSSGRIISYFDSTGGSNPGYSGGVLGLQYPTADNTFTTGFVLRNGNVGIGTTNPSERLTVMGGGGFSVGNGFATSTMALNATSTFYSFQPHTTSGNSAFLFNTTSTMINGNIFDWQDNSQSLLTLSASGTLRLYNQHTNSPSSTQMIVRAGAGQSTDNMLTIQDNDASTLFGVNKTIVSINNPLEVAVAGDVGIAYDLEFTNPDAAYIKSQSPLYITAGDPNQNHDLTMSATGDGEVIVADNFLVYKDYVSTSGTQRGAYVDVNDTGWMTGTLIGLDVDVSGVASGTVYSALFQGGLVGIGNSTPTSTLDLTSVTSTRAVAIIRGASGQAKNMLEFRNSSDSLLAYFDQNGNFSTSGTTSTFSYGATFATAGGNVGIGTASPGYTVDIQGTNPQLRIYGTGGATNYTLLRMQNSGGTALFGQEPSAGGTLLSGALPYYFDIAHTGGYGMHLGTNNTVRMTIESTGFVGIGTTDPTHLLTLFANATSSALLAVGNGVATTTIAGGAAGSATTTFAGDVSIPNLFLGSMEFDVDAGLVAAIDLPVSGSATAGTKEGYSFLIDGIPVMTVVGESNGSGEARNGYVGIGTQYPSHLLTMVSSSPTLAIGTGSATTTITVGNRGIATSTFYSDLSIVSRDVVIGGGNGSGATGWLYVGNGQATTSIRGGLSGFATSTFEGDVSIANLFSGMTEFGADSGVVAAMNMPVSASASDGSLEGYSFMIDGIPAMTIAGISNAAGETRNNYVGIGTMYPSALLTVVSSSPQIAIGTGSATTTLTVGNRGVATSTFYSDLSIVNRDAIIGGAANTGWLYIGDGTATTSIRGGAAGSATTTFAGDVSISNLYLGATEFAVDAGIVDAMDLPVSASASAGTLEGYNFLIDGQPTLSIIGQSNGSGEIKNNFVGIGTMYPSHLLTMVSSSPTLAIGTGSATTTITVGNRGIATSTFYSDLSIVGRDVIIGGGSGSGVTGWLYVGNGIATTTIRGGAAGSVTSTFEGDVSIPNLYLGSLIFDTDAGIVDAMDLPVSASASAGTFEGYNFSVDGIPILSVIAQANGSGEARNGYVGIGTQYPSHLLTMVSSSPTLAIGTGSATTTLTVGNRGVATSTFYSDLSIVNRDAIIGGAANTGWLYIGDGTATTSIRGGAAGSATTTFAGDIVISNMYLGSTEFSEDAGIVGAFSMPVSASAATGTEEGYTFAVDNADVMRVVGTSDALGSVWDLRLELTDNKGTATTTIRGTTGTTSTFAGNVQVNGQFAVTGQCTEAGGACADIAEQYNSIDEVEAGDVVISSLATPSNLLSSPYNSALVEKSKTGYAANVVGVVSTNPGLTLGLGGIRIGSGGPGGATKPNIALAGRVPVKVTNENGIIKKGDYLVTSAVQPGYAMKYSATSTAPQLVNIFAMALDDWDPATEITEEGYKKNKITVLIKNVLVQNNNFGDDLTITEKGADIIADGEYFDFSGKALVNIKSLTSVSGSWSLSEEGEFVAKSVKAKVVSLNELIVAGEKETDASGVELDPAVGNSFIPNGEQVKVIYNNRVKKNSQIFITFRDNTGGPWWISNQGDGFFEVSVPASMGYNIRFSFWIVSVEGGDSDPANPKGYNGVTQDTTAPEITAVAAVNITDAGATINWSTSEDADSIVTFATSSVIASPEGAWQSLNSSDLSSSHSLNLTNLTPQATYYYIVKSTDSAGNVSESQEYSFTTAGSSSSPLVTEGGSGEADGGSNASSSTPDTSTSSTPPVILSDSEESQSSSTPSGT